MADDRQPERQGGSDDQAVERTGDRLADVGRIDRRGLVHGSIVKEAVAPVECRATSRKGSNGSRLVAPRDGGRSMSRPTRSRP